MKLLMKMTFVGLALPLAWASNAQAAGGLLSLGIEPIVGYERVQKLVPTPHTSDRLTYGVRLTAGLPLLSAEAEYTRGTDTESFPVDGVDTKDTADKAKLGLRSSLRLGPVIRVIARGGVQATQNQHEETRAGVTTVTKEQIKYRPYAGTGLRASLTPKISLSVEIVAVFNQWPDMNKNEYQTTAGFQIRVP